MATVEERLAFVEGRVQEHSQMFAGLRETITSLEQRMDRRFDHVDARFTVIEERLNGVDRRFEALEQKIASLDTKLDHKFDFLDQKIDALDRKFDEKLDALDRKFDEKLAADWTGNSTRSRRPGAEGRSEGRRPRNESRAPARGLPSGDGQPSTLAGGFAGDDAAGRDRRCVRALTGAASYGAGCGCCW